MLADGVPDPLFKRAFVTAQYAWLAGIEAAEQAWNNEDLSPETLALLLLAEVSSIKGARAQMTSSPTPVTGEGTSTPKRGSSSGTSGRRVTKRTAAAKPSRSGGAGSRSTGTSSKRTGHRSTSGD